jgi:alpha-galactosidase
VWVKDLQDNTKAFGVFNLGDKSEKYTLDLKKLGIQERASVRDLWRQKEITAVDNVVELTVPSHGVVLMKYSRYVFQVEEK